MIPLHPKPNICGSKFCFKSKLIKTH